MSKDWGSDGERCGDYDPYYEFDEDYDEDRDMEPDDCGFGSFGCPQLGVEECEFTCPLSKPCREIFFARKDCVFPIFPEEWEPQCHWFHMGSCYIDFSNYSPSRSRQLWIRLKCRFRILPEYPYARYYEEEEK